MIDLDEEGFNVQLLSSGSTLKHRSTAHGHSSYNF